MPKDETDKAQDAKEPEGNVHNVKATVGVVKEKQKDGSVNEVEYNRSITVSYDYLNSVAEQVEAFGEDVVKALFTRAGITALRNQCTGYIRSGKTDDEILELVKNWKPPLGAVRVKKSALQRIRESLPDMNAEDKAELKALLKEID